ncbi:MAG: NAD(P)-dependent oxidoreductase [Chloroflexota bacterium]|nr:NAD(P)-dependent oxidoreductase [Chloroflexota bacterium]
MRVLITGGAGHVGTPITKRFADRGWDVRVIGVDPTCDLAGVTYSQCDILDCEALQDHVAGCDAIVHLAAIPSTISHPNHALFETNVAGTYNVFEAAERAGVKRIAQASSINALGGYWGCDDRQFEYFPLDEAHPLHTTDAYSFSKQLLEEIAAYYWRRSGISSVSFRLPAVWSDDLIEERQLRGHLGEKREAVDEFRKLPQDEQRRQVAAAREAALKLRARHVMEYEAAQAGGFDRYAPADDWLFSSYFFDRFNYWTFIHTDDSTQAFERAITADFSGAHPLFVNSDRNYLDYDSEALLAIFFPDVPGRSKAIAGAQALVSYDRARDLLGYEATVHVV